MTLIRPFRALRPVPTRAREIIAPPYDVLSSAEARERAKGKPWSFLHVSKAEIDLPAGTDAYAPRSTPRRPRTSQRMRTEGVLMRDANPYYYAYRATWTGGRQTGLACVASLDAYAAGRIKKHELTTPVKETDRVKQIEALDAQTGPVMMAYPHAPELDRALKRATERDPGRGRHGRRRRHPRAVGDRRCRRDRRLHRKVRGAARALHRRRPPPQRGGSARGGGARRRRRARTAIS